MENKKRVNVHAELTSIKNDMIRLVTLTQSIFERISHLEDGVASRKRAATNDFDSDAFSEDELQSKIIKLEQDAQSSESKSEKNGVKSAVGKLKASIFSNPMQPIPRPSTSVRPSSSSTSVSSSSKTSTPNPKASSPTMPFVYDNQRLVVYTDGSCFNNGKANAKGGIGVYFYDKCPLNVSAPLPGKQSNNRAELQAACRALIIAREKKMGPVQIRTDSGYVKQGITSWINTWKKNGWRTASNNEVKNVEDWKELDALRSSMDVEWKWVEAHKGIHGNEMADQLANNGARMNS